MIYVYFYSVITLKWLTRISPIRFSPTGHSPMAKFHCTFANITQRISPIGESPLNFRQYTPRNFANWRESTVLSPMHLRTFAIGECPVGESLIGEIREPL